MLKDYLKKNGISVYSLSKQCHIPYSSLSDLVNNKVSVDSCSVGMVRALANQLGQTMDAFCSLCAYNCSIVVEKYDMCADISVKNKTYYANFSYDNKSFSIPVCAVNEETTKYMSQIVNWHVEDCIEDYKFERKAESQSRCGT